MLQRIRSPNIISANSDHPYELKTQALNIQPPILKNSSSNQNYHSKYTPTCFQPSYLPIQSNQNLLRVGSEKELQESHLKQLKSILDNNNVRCHNITQSQEIKRTYPNTNTQRVTYKNVNVEPSNNYSQKSTLEKLQEFKQVIDRLVAQKNLKSKTKPQQSVTTEGKDFRRSYKNGEEEFGNKTQKYFNRQSNRDDRSTSNNIRLSFKINSDLESMELQITQQIMSLRSDKLELEQKLQEQMAKNHQLKRLLKKDDMNDNESIIFRLKKDDRSLEQQNNKLKAKIRTLELQLLTIQQSSNKSNNFSQANKINLQNVVMHLERELTKKDHDIAELKKIIDKNMRSTNKRIWGSSDNNSTQLQTIHQKSKPNPIMRQNNKLEIQINRLKSQNDRLRRQKESSLQSEFVFNLQKQVQGLRIENENLKREIGYKGQEYLRRNPGEKKQSFSKYFSPSTQNLISSNEHERSRVTRKDGEYNQNVEVVKTIKNIYKY